MSEGVELLISADDQASKVLDKVTDNVDAKVKRIKEVGGRAKASTEFIGTLAGSLGGSELASYAGSLGQLTEKISAFSEISKAGGAGATLFKAGLAGVVAVGAFKAGQAIGEIVFQTKMWSEELEKAEQKSQRLFSQVEQLRDFRFGTELEGLTLIKDPEKQAAAAKQMRESVEKEILGLQATIKQTRELENDSSYAWNATPGERAIDKQTIADAEKQIEQLRKQRQEIDQLFDARKKENEELRQSNALKERNAAQIESLQNEVELLKARTEAEKATVEARQRAGGDTEAAARMEALIREKDALLAKAEAQKQADADAKRAADEQVKSAERIADLKKNELAKLEEQRILLTKGKEAAHAFALEQQGIDKATAKSIAIEKSKLDKQAEKITEQAPQQAVQGRLITRGTADDIRKRQLDAALKAYEVLKAIQANTKEFKSQTELAFEVVGR